VSKPTDLISPITPRATYRLQFNADFKFVDACRQVPYLAALGISHVYASPLLLARPGSTHGYDIVDHGRLNPEIGTEAEFNALVAELHRHDMGLILDFVPNHMGVGVDNPWWVDILEWGQSSPYAGYFDIDWQPPEASLSGKLLLPVLGDHYGAVLERGELELRFDAEVGRFAVGYFEHTFPVAPRDYTMLLRNAAVQITEAEPILQELAEAFRGASRDRRGGESRRLITAFKQRLSVLVKESTAVAEAISRQVNAFNAVQGGEALHRLLERQHYRLAFWRVAAHEINYRRFFDINELAGLRMERPELLRDSHQLIVRLLEENKIQGLRLDHVDGLRDPRAYLARLRNLAPGRGVYLLVEKILAGHESLRSDWPVAGTTGYEFLNLVNGLFVDPEAERSLTRSYEHFIGNAVDFAALTIAAKRQIIREALASELQVLANRFNRLAKQNRYTRDYSLIGLREALTEVIAYFPVYRTYVTARRTTSEDRRDLGWAVAKASKTARTPDKSIYDFIHGVLSLDLLYQDGYRRRDVIDAALRFQQLTGPVMAKALEDTAFYRYMRLVSLNEVGGEPEHFGRSPAAFHEANRRRLRDWPAAMLTSATHDHKRGEDMRARLNVLSEIPSEWRQRTRRWSGFNRRKKRDLDGLMAPDRNDEYLFYQTLVGAWPYSLDAPEFAGIDTFCQRLTDYMLKAVREAKRHTSWVACDEDYEAALVEFIERTLNPEYSLPFLEDVVALVTRISPAGAVNSLAQTVLKLTSPGVPDIYQGNEYWDFSLVDPDNRRPVDYAQRAASLAASDWQDQRRSWRDGRLKQHIIRSVLALRRAQPELFATGSYQALTVEGQQADRVVAFARILDDSAYCVIVPRLVRPLLADPDELLLRDWEDTHIVLPEGWQGRQWREVITDQVQPCEATARVETLLAALPVAVYRLQD